MKRVAVLGSSGGNLFSLGGAEPEKLLQEIFVQAESAGVTVAAVQFIAASVSMDMARTSTPASLYFLEGEHPRIVAEATLAEINAAAVSYDAKIAGDIRAGKIDGLILMSVDPNGANKQAIAAAIEKKLPIVGTGGTAMALTTSLGGQVIATSGTTGTTSRTRAISFIASLCKHWGIKYTPILGGAPRRETVGERSSWISRLSLRSIMVPALPGFIAMAIVLALSKIPGLDALGDVFKVMVGALPVMVAVMAAKQVSDLDEVSIIAGIVAGVLSVNGGIIGGILGGIGAGILVRWLFEVCINLRFPMTTVNIVAGGLSGLASGLVIYFLLAPLALEAGDLIKQAIEYVLAVSPLLTGLVAGALIWPAILGGVYHAALLPLVLLEMEKSGSSFVGAVDMAGLVMVAAGINAANVLFPRDKGEAAVAAPGLLINIGFGTFVESAYPFMFSNRWVFAGALFSAAMGGMVLGAMDVRGTAYVAAFAAPFLSNNPFGFIAGMGTSFVLAFVITVAANKMSRVKVSSSAEMPESQSQPSPVALGK